MIRVRAGEARAAAPGYVRRTIRFESDPPIRNLWYMTPERSRPLSEDWLVPAAMIAGMARAADVHVTGTVSRRLLDSIPEIQRVIALRNEGLRPIRLTADTVAPTPRAASPLILSCLSNGVDALYTALDPELGIDEHLYVHGTEVPLRARRTLPVVLPHVKAAARELGRPLRLAETNWRDVIEPMAGNRLVVIIPLLATFAYLMESDVTRFILPATCDVQYPPDDPSSIRSFVGRWSTEAIEVGEHGHVSRFEKFPRLVESGIAMRHLRVCWSKNQTRYNCGYCIKCVRTRVHLKLAGAEGRCATLPPRLDLTDVRRAHPEKPNHGNYVDENIELAEAQGLTDLAAALRTQREQPADHPMRNRPRARIDRWFRRARASVAKRVFDVRWRRIQRLHGDDHPFNYVGEQRGVR